MRHRYGVWGVVVVFAMIGLAVSANAAGATATARRDVRADDHDQRGAAGRSGLRG